MDSEILTEAERQAIEVLKNARLETPEDHQQLLHALEIIGAKHSQAEEKK